MFQKVIKYIDQAHCGMATIADWDSTCTVPLKIEIFSLEAQMLNLNGTRQAVWGGIWGDGAKQETQLCRSSLSP